MNVLSVVENTAQSKSAIIIDGQSI